MRARACHGSSLRFRVLGPVEFQWDGGDWQRPRAPKRREVLAALLANANRAVSTDRLCEYLWESPPKSATKLVQVYVHQLRGELGDLEGRWLRTQDRRYVIDVGSGELDVHRFTEAVSLGELAAEAADDHGAAQHFRRALGMWRGSAFEDLRGSAQGRLEGIQLDEQRLIAMESAFQAELACGRHREVIGELTAAVRRFPLRERLYELLIVALGRAGRRSEAVAVYQDLNRTLTAELGAGVRPSLMANRLIREIMGHHYGSHCAAARQPGVAAGA